MATRIYFPGSIPAGLQPSSWSAGWNATTADTNTFGALTTLLSSDTGANFATGQATGTNPNTVAARRYITRPLSAQTISGTVKGQMRVAEGAATDDRTLAVAIKAVTSAGADRGVLLAVSASDTATVTPPEMSTALTNRPIQDAAENTALSLSSVAVSDGDRLVIEWGTRTASTIISSFGAAGPGWRADSGVSDLPEDSTSTSNFNPWVEFSGDIAFLNAPYLYASASTPSDSATATGTADPTAVTPPTGMLAGDLVCMVAQERDATTTLTVSATGGQTWTTEAQIITTNQTARLFWCTFNGIWSANPSVDFAAGTAVNTVVMHVFRPPATDYTWSVNQAQVELDFAAAATITITGQTTTGTDPTVTLAGWFTDDDNTWGTLTGTDWGLCGTAQYRNTSGTDQSCTFAHKIQTAAGATGNVSKTQLTLGNDSGTSFIITFAATAPASPPTPQRYTVNRSFAVTRAAHY